MRLAILNLESLHLSKATSTVIAIRIHKNFACKCSKCGHIMRITRRPHVKHNFNLSESLEVDVFHHFCETGIVFGYGTSQNPFVIYVLSEDGCHLRGNGHRARILK